jgi:Transglycosylase SLT domain
MTPRFNRSITWTVRVLLTMLVVLSVPPAAIAAVPITDAARTVQESRTRQQTLDIRGTKRGQSASTEGVGCNFRRSKQQAMSERGDVAKKIAQTCQRVGVEPALGLSIAYQESQFNQNCKAPTTPWSGGERATGVMQVLPATAARVGRQYAGRPLNVSNEDDNILAGCLYLKEGAKVTKGSEYHTITGYHNGYGSRVMRENLPLPEGWKNGLKYGDLVQNRHLPYFRSVVGGTGDPGRFQWDQLQTNIYSASANGIQNIQSGHSTFSNRLGEMAPSIGQASTTISAWDDNSRMRLQGGEVQNNAIDALSILMQLRMVQLMATTMDTSETAKLLDLSRSTPPGSGTLVRNPATGETFAVNLDGSTTRVRPDEQPGAAAARIASQPAKPSMPATATGPPVTLSQDDVIQRLGAVQSLARN